METPYLCVLFCGPKDAQCSSSPSVCKFGGKEREKTASDETALVKSAHVMMARVGRGAGSHGAGSHGAGSHGASSRTPGILLPVGGSCVEETPRSEQKARPQAHVAPWVGAGKRPAHRVRLCPPRSVLA